MSVARKSEVTIGDPLTGAALGESLKKVSGHYEEMIKEAGLYKSEKK